MERGEREQELDLPRSLIRPQGEASSAQFLFILVRPPERSLPLMTEGSAAEAETQ